MRRTQEKEIIAIIQTYFVVKVSLISGFLSLKAVVFVETAHTSTVAVQQNLKHLCLAGIHRYQPSPSRPKQP